MFRLHMFSGIAPSESPAQDQPIYILALLVHLTYQDTANFEQQSLTTPCITTQNSSMPPLPQRLMIISPNPPPLL